MIDELKERGKRFCSLFLRVGEVVGEFEIRWALLVMVTFFCWVVFFVFLGVVIECFTFLGVVFSLVRDFSVRFSFLVKVVEVCGLGVRVLVVFSEVFFCVSEMIFSLGSFLVVIRR